MIFPNLFEIIFENTEGGKKNPKNKFPSPTKTFYIRLFISNQYKNLMNIKEQAKEYDAIIVGSGAGGGMAAYVLAKAGAKVALLEAGGFYDPADAKYITQLKKPWESPRRGASTPLRNFGDWDAAWGGWQLDGEPYTHKGDTKFDWFRSRMLGGRTNHWGRISLRFGPNDFKAKTIDGLGEDWPIGYDDIKPFYDKLDQFVGLFGSNEGMYNEPDGIFLPPPKPRLHELFLQKVLEFLLFLRGCLCLRRR